MRASLVADELELSTPRAGGKRTKPPNRVRRFRRPIAASRKASSRMNIAHSRRFLRIPTPFSSHPRLVRLSPETHRKADVANRQPWAKGRLGDYVSITAGVPRIAADLLQRPSWQSRATSRSLMKPFAGGGPVTRLGRAGPFARMLGQVLPVSRSILWRADGSAPASPGRRPQSQLKLKPEQVGEGRL